MSSAMDETANDMCLEGDIRIECEEDEGIDR